MKPLLTSNQFLRAVSQTQLDPRRDTDGNQALFTGGAKENLADLAIFDLEADATVG
jgi:hypothetical protein